LKGALVGFFLMISITGPASAQARAPDTFARTDTVIAPKRNVGGIRFAGALGGAFVGAIGGAYLGYNILPRDCACDDPGLDALIWGGLGGITIGAAFGAAAANLGSQCDFGASLKRTLLGAGAGGIAAYFVAGGASNEGTVIAVPAAAIGGSLAALGKCWRPAASQRKN
jgi:hypothetical protein